VRSRLEPPGLFRGARTRATARKPRLARMPRRDSAVAVDSIFKRGCSPYKGARVKKALPRLAAGAGPLSSSGSFQAKPMTRAANRPLIASSTRDRLLIAASDRARASGSLDGYRPAAPVAPVIGIIVITTITLTVAGLTNVK
jgi:hypothetical protein